MRIGFDCAPLVIPHSPGIRRVVEKTLEALEHRGNMQVVRLLPEAGEHLGRWRRRGLKRLVREHDLQGLHAFQSAFCFGASVPTAQTVHELSWLHDVSERGAWKQKLWVWLGRRRASAVVCATGFSARDYRGASPIGPDPTIVPWGVDDLFDGITGPEDGTKLESWGLSDAPYVLSPGGLRPKKRSAELLHALAKCDVPDPGHLVFTGPTCDHWVELQSLARHHRIADRVHFLEDFSDRDLAVLYRHARATAVISHSEGFALPVLESLVSGTVPLVTADSAQSEVAGPHGIQVPGRDQPALDQAVQDVLARRPQVDAAGIRHARNFTWDRTAQGIEELWRNLI